MALALAAFVLWGIPYFFQPPPPQIGTPFGAETVRARVLEIIEEGEIELGGVTQQYEILRVELLEGPYTGIPMEVDYGRRQVRPEGMTFRPGDQILVTIGKRQDGVLSAYFVDYVRTGTLGWMALVFAAAIILISRWKGVRSLVGMAFSLLVIIGYIIPHILKGEDPVRVSIIGSAILLGVTLYLTYGWTLKTHASVLGMLLVLILTGTLAWLFVGAARLTGTGDESAMFLMQMSEARINLRGLLLGGIIIGALGVLDDLVTTQSSAVFELHAADDTLGFRSLFTRAMRIGQDHVAATVNTLLLAYAGASLPMLLLFSLSGGNYASLLNYAFVAEEVVRTLVGSLGLVAAVPITTAIATGLALYHHRLGGLRPYLGPENSGGGHVH
jgi:uncharacterized membrane protein